nr:MAG TPA: hypothetical protein [Caudoviricetes sp.]
MMTASLRHIRSCRWSMPRRMILDFLLQRDSSKSSMRT